MLGLVQFIKWDCNFPWKLELNDSVWKTQGGWAQYVFPPLVGTLYAILVAKLRDEQILSTQVSVIPSEVAPVMNSYNNYVSTLHSAAYTVHAFQCMHS